MVERPLDVSCGEQRDLGKREEGAEAFASGSLRSKLENHQMLSGHTDVKSSAASLPLLRKMYVHNACRIIHTSTRDLHCYCEIWSRH